MENHSKLTEDSDKIIVNGHTGTWYVIDAAIIDNKRLFLLESMQYGDEAACLIVDENGALVLDDVYNGFDDYIEQVFDHLKDIVISAMREAGYCYNELESHDGYQIFNGACRPLTFESFSEAADWLNGVVFDDPNVSDRVEQIMHQ